MGGTRGREDVRSAKIARISPPFLGRERAAVAFDVDPERRSPRYQGNVALYWIPRALNMRIYYLFPELKIQGQML